jgi:hypothetical protein
MILNLSERSRTMFTHELFNDRDCMLINLKRKKDKATCKNNLPKAFDAANFYTHSK